jgi:hypothetical protein
LGGVLRIVLGTLRATALLGFGWDLLGDVLSLVLGTLGATPLLRSVILKREYEVLDLTCEGGGAAVLGYGVGGDMGDKIIDTLGDINDAGWMVGSRSAPGTLNDNGGGVVNHAGH